MTSPPKLVTTSPNSLTETNVLSEKMSVGVQGLALTADGRWLVAGCGPALSLINTRTGETIKEFKRDPKHRFDIVSLSSDERWLAVCSLSAMGVDIYDFATGELRYQLPDREGTVNWLAWQPGAPRLAVARDNGAIGIWDLNKVEAEIERLGLRLH